MQAKLNSPFCGDHTGIRVQCPHGNHTVPEAQLRRHLRICQDRIVNERRAAHPSIRDGVNAGPGPDLLLPAAPPGLEDARGRLDSSAARRQAWAVAMGRDGFSDLVRRVEQACGTATPQLEPLFVADAPEPTPHAAAVAAAVAVAARADRPSSEKHAAQQASILGHMSRWGLLDRPLERTFIEFGAGRGYLSSALADCCAAEHLVLMDVKGYRHKADRGLRHTRVLRLQCDIADFEPAGIAELAPPGRGAWVGLGKHLCGAAADLTLRCCARYLPTPAAAAPAAAAAAGPADGGAGPGAAVEAAENGFVGVAIATCCHHRCCWRHYVGREVMEELGFTPEEFEVICWMTGWALCGHDAAAGCADADQADDDDAEEESAQVSCEAGSAPARPAANATYTTPTRPHHWMSRVRRVALGQRCKRLLDYGRAEWMRRQGFKVESLLYVDPSVSGENRLVLGGPLSAAHSA